MAEKLCELKKNGSSTPTVKDITIFNQSGYAVIYNGTSLVRSTGPTKKIQRGDFQCWYNNSNFTIQCGRAGTFYNWIPSTETGDPTNIPANTPVSFNMGFGGVFVYS